MEHSLLPQNRRLLVIKGLLPCQPSKIVCVENWKNVCCTQIYLSPCLAISTLAVNVVTLPVVSKIHEVIQISQESLPILSKSRKVSVPLVFLVSASISKCLSCSVDAFVSRVMICR